MNRAACSHCQNVINILNRTYLPRTHTLSMSPAPTAPHASVTPPTNTSITINLFNNNDRNYSSSISCLGRVEMKVVLTVMVLSLQIIIIIITALIIIDIHHHHSFNHHLYS